MQPTILRKKGSAEKQKASGEKSKVEDSSRTNKKSRGSGEQGLGLDSLLHGLVELAHPVFLLENLARLGAIGRSDDAVFLHEVYEPRRAAVSHA